VVAGAENSMKYEDKVFAKKGFGTLVVLDAI